MEFSLLSYNVLFNQACHHLKKIVQEHCPDIICLQEIDTDKTNLKLIERLGYILADYSNSFIKFGKIYGVATFYNPKIFSFKESEAIYLPKTILEVFLTIIRVLRGGNQPRTVLRTNFVNKKTNNDIAVYNTHLSLYGTNGIRLKQIREILKDVGLHQKKRVIFSGDFNYFPYRRKMLSDLMTEYQLLEATKNLSSTFLYNKKQYNRFGLISKYFVLILAKIITSILSKKYKVDYIYYKNLSCLKTKKVDLKYSDHYPIISKFAFNKT